MNTRADKTKDNKGQAIASAGSQVQSGGESTFQFLDNRPEAVAQRQLQEMVNNSPRVKQVAQLQAMADNYSDKQQQPIQKNENNTGLPDNLKSGIENLSGYSMDDVKVHYNSNKPAQLQALAFAQGTDIHLGPGQEKHLSHEAWHVVQQKQGRVKPTMQMKGKVIMSDDAGLETEADVMGAKALSTSYGSNLNTPEIHDRSQLRTINPRPIVQRWIMMGTGLDLGKETLKKDIAITSKLFEPKSKKPIDDKFILLTKFDEVKKHVAEALKFLEIKHNSGPKEYVTIEDVEPLLKSWMGIVPEENIKTKHKKTSFGELEFDEFESGKLDRKHMKDEVLPPINSPDQYSIRAASGMPAEMRYYVTYEELAWALVQASGFQAPEDLSDDYYSEIAIARSVSISGNILGNLKAALNKVFDKIAKLNVDQMKASPDYASFHKINSWQKFKEKYESKYEPDTFIGLITFLHDIKSYFAITKHDILKDKPEKIVVKGKKKDDESRKEGDFPEEMQISKEDMRYNLGTVDEADPFVLFMRERGRNVWAAPSFTTVSMLQIVKGCGGNKNELTSIAYGIFAFWCIHYPHTATPIHTFHEVMAAAQAFGVTYDPDKSVVNNANKESLLEKPSYIN